MSTRTIARWPCLWLSSLLAVAGGCGRSPSPDGARPGGETPSQGGDPIAELNRGVGLLEQYQYLDAFQAFDALTGRFPDWEAAHVNKGIAALNLQDEYFKVAEASFRRAMELNPRSPHAMLSLAVLYNYTERPDEALELARKVVDIDPSDPHALYHLGVFLFDKGKYDESKVVLEKVIKLQPSFASAHYRLMSVYPKTGDAAKRDAARETFSRLKAADAGVLVGNKYGENGKYNCAIRDSAPPGWRKSAPPWKPEALPTFGAVTRIGLGPAARRERPDGKPQSPGFAVEDLSGDGVCELVLCGEVPAPGGEPRTSVYRKPSAAEPWSLWFGLPDAVLCAIGDLDSNGKPAVILAGDGWLRAFVEEQGKPVERELVVEKGNHAGSPVRLYCADIDSDWDLDIVCLRQESGEGGQVRSRLELISNNRDGKFRDVSGDTSIEPFGFAASELLVTDLDGDVDADLVVIDGTSGKPYVFENERLWRYRLEDDARNELGAPGAVLASTGDLDGDGDLDLVVCSPGSTHFWRNAGGLRFEPYAELQQRSGGLGGTTAIVADLLGALRPAVLLLDARGTGGSFRVGEAPAPAILHADASSWARVEIGGLPPAGAQLAAVLTVVGLDGPAELLVFDTANGASSRPLAAGANWIALTLEGTRNPIPDKERSNLSGLGATVEIRAGGRSLVVPVDGSSGGTARAPARAFTGLAGTSHADYARILWPDAVLQSELSLPGGKVHRIREIQRKPTSCPMLFAWDGGEFRFVGDFLGVGGLGYFELPGVYSRPDPSEHILLPDFRPRDGSYALEVLEPMEECTYLDELKLTVVDHPASVTIVPEEMFAIRGPAPGFRLLALSERLFARSAADETGRDATADLLEVDRRYGNRVDRDPRFPGLCRRDHALELDFGDALEPWTEGDRPVHLVLHGFVEYGYSTSNFAAWQAGETFRAPTVKVRRGGDWVPLREEWGFPGGYPRYMTIDLSGLLRPGDRQLRVETNMVILWDQAFLGREGAGLELEVVELAPDEAVLSWRGFPAEEPMEASIHPVYVYRDFDTIAPIKVFPGEYTSHGDVRPLLDAADDRFAIFGPGDGLSLRFRADRVPALREGRRRTFLVKAFGYCKDTDLYTAHPDRVEPLPFLGMDGYPFERPAPESPLHDEYLRTWNRRRIEGRMLDPVWAGHPGSSAEGAEDPG